MSYFVTHAPRRPLPRSVYRRRRAAGVIVLAAIAGAGLGALVGGFGSIGGAPAISGSPKEAVGVVQAFERALGRHEWATICDRLYSSAARTGAGGQDCPARLAAAAGGVSDPKARILNVTVHGDQATVAVSARVSGGSPVTSQIHLIREHGDYRILYSGSGDLGD
jgi:hypothetical protein